MTASSSVLQVEGNDSKAALVFDADSISLTGRFSDELAAYRARKQWGQALSEHFLLDKGRDFEPKITVDEDQYVLKCSFHSACGRYAFWRLVNHQAPDVEAKLKSTDLLNRKTARFLLGSLWNNTPAGAAERAIEKAAHEVDETSGVMVSLLKLFKRI